MPPAVLAAAFVAVVLVNLRVPTPSDQVHYMQAAAMFPHPLRTNAIHQATRFGLILPMRPAIAVFGYSQAAYCVVPILATLTLLFGTYALGAQLFSRPVGAAAAVVVGTSVPVFTEATEPLPDIFAAGLFTVALSIALAIRRRRVEPRWWVPAGLGLVLGWSYLVREFIVFLWPLIPILLYRRLGRRGLIWLAAPIAVLLTGETLLCRAVYGDPLTRVHAVTHHAEGALPATVAHTFRDKPRHVYLLRLPQALLEHSGGGWLLGLLALTLVGGLISVLRTQRRFAILVIWCALLWVPLSLLGGLLDPHLPKLRLQLIRYWLPIFPAFALGGIGLLWLAGRVLRDRIRAGVAAALPVVLVLGVAAAAAGSAAREWWARPGTRVSGGTQLEAFRSWMSRHGDGVRRVWADERTVKVLRIYRYGPFGGLAWHATVSRAGRGRVIPPGDLVVFYDVRPKGRMCGYCRLAERQVWGAPPRPAPGWREVYATRDGVVRVYAVARSTTVPLGRRS